MSAAEHSENSDFLEVDNVIYEATVTTTSVQEKDLRKTPPPDTRRNKRVGVGVGLLFAVLVLLNVAIPLYLHQSYMVEKGQLENSNYQLHVKINNLTKERDQLLDRNTNLTEERETCDQSYKVEKEQLLFSYNNLIKERDQLLYRNNHLTLERDDMKSKICDQSYKVEKEQLVISYNNLIKEREQLLDKNTNLAVERDGMRRMLCELPGWQTFDGGLYYISTERKTWEDSRRWCSDRQSDLIVIKSQRKQDFVARFNKRVWLGLTDRAREGYFQWIDGTALTTAAYWVPGTPNNREPGTNAEEDCAEYYETWLSSRMERCIVFSQ